MAASLNSLVAGRKLKRENSCKLLRPTPPQLQGFLSPFAKSYSPPSCVHYRAIASRIARLYFSFNGLEFGTLTDYRVRDTLNRFQAFLVLVVRLLCGLVVCWWRPRKALILGVAGFFLKCGLVVKFRHAKPRCLCFVCTEHAEAAVMNQRPASWIGMRLSVSCLSPRTATFGPLVYAVTKCLDQALLSLYSCSPSALEWPCSLIPMPVSSHGSGTQRTLGV